MSDELADDIKKKFMLSLTIELQDHKEKVFHKAPVSPNVYKINQTFSTNLAKFSNK